MKISQKIALAAMASLAMNMQPSAAKNQNINVTGTNTATVDAATDTAGGTITKLGTGTLVFTGNANNTPLGTLDIRNGTVKVSATNNFGGGTVSFTMNANNILAVTTPSVNVPALTMTTAGTLLANNSGNINLSAAPSGTQTLLIAATTPSSDTVTITSNMSASTTPINVSGHLIAGNTSTATPSGALNVLSGGTLKLAGASAGSVPSATVIQSGATLSVDSSLSIPLSTSPNDVFGTLQFSSDSTLELGDGVIWSRNVVVDTAS